MTIEQSNAIMKLNPKVIKNKNDFDSDDFESAFDAIWYSVLHEFDLHDEGDQSYLNSKELKKLQTWLKSTQKFTTEFKKIIIKGP